MWRTSHRTSLSLGLFVPFKKSLLRRSLAMSPGLASHATFLPWSLECWDYRHVPWLPASSLLIRGMEFKWLPQRHLRESKGLWRRTWIHVADAHEKCCFLASLSPWDPATTETSAGLTLSHSAVTRLSLCTHRFCSTSRQLGAGYNENRGLLWLNFYHRCFLESLCESKIINKVKWYYV